MPNRRDLPIYRTFEEFEREELRRADAASGDAGGMFDDLVEDFDLETPRQYGHNYGDDEE